MLLKYKQVFNYQPEIFIILGGNASILKHQGKLLQKNVKTEVVLKHDESVKMQMRGALFYAKKSDRFIFV